MKINFKYYHIFFLLLTLSVNLFSEMKSPDEFNKRQTRSKQIGEVNFLVVPLKVYILFYQKIISPIKQENCQMYPSCSHYGMSAINRNGLKGLLMLTDRLHRCGHDLQFYKTVIVNNEIKYLDLAKDE